MIWWSRWRAKRIGKAIARVQLELVGLRSQYMEAQTFKNRSAQLLATNALQMKIEIAEQELHYLQQKVRRYGRHNP